MRASGRGGRQGPRGDPVPPRALLRFRGMCARPVLRSGVAFSCARARSVFGDSFPACGAFPRSGGAHALSAALYIDKGRCQNAICGRRWNAKREAAERRAS